MKKKVFLFTMMLQVSSALFAQSSDTRSDVNNILSTTIVPVLGLLLFIGFAVLVIANLDAIRGKNGSSSEEGWMNVGKGVAYIVVAITILGFVAAKLSSMNFSV